MQYLSSGPAIDECIFCKEFQADAPPPLYRNALSLVMLNAYPYNSGHLMVAPGRHVAAPTDLNRAERHDLMDVTVMAMDALDRIMKPEGFNVGMNVGAPAGAGIPGHLHVHVVPRWEGDTNFMPVVGETKVLPELLAETEAKLRPAFAGLDPQSPD